MKINSNIALVFQYHSFPMGAAERYNCITNNYVRRNSICDIIITQNAKYNKHRRKRDFTYDYFHYTRIYDEGLLVKVKHEWINLPITEFHVTKNSASVIFV